MLIEVWKICLSGNFLYLIHQSHLVQSETLLPILFLVPINNLYCSDQRHVEIVGKSPPQINLV